MGSEKNNTKKQTSISNNPLKLFSKIAFPDV